MSINLDLCKRKSAAMARYENERCCIALTHDYGGIITGLIVIKTPDGNKIFTTPYFNLKLRDLEKVNGAGYEIKAGNRTEVIPPRIIHRFVKEIRKSLLRERKNRKKDRLKK